MFLREQSALGCVFCCEQERDGEDWVESCEAEEAAYGVACYACFWLERLAFLVSLDYKCRERYGN